MVADAKTTQRRWRLKVLSSGAAALAVVGVVGAVIALPAVQESLSSQVKTRLTADGVEGVTVRFSGRDGIVSCDAPLQDPSKAKQIILATSGVGNATLDPSCTGAPLATVPGSTVSRSTLPSATTVPAVVRTTSAASTVPGSTTVRTATTVTATTVPVAKTVPAVTVPVTTTVPASTTTTVAVTTSPPTAPPATSTTAGGPIAPAQTAVASMLGGTIVLSGTLQSDAQRQVLDAAASTVVDPANISDEFIVDPTSTLSDDDVSKLGTLITVMARNLVNGEAGFDNGLYIHGTYLSTTSQNAVRRAAATTGAQTNLQARPSATPSQAGQLALAMTALVLQRPTMFNKDGTFTASANATLDQIAALANRYDNLSISIRGYTDIDVIAARTNQNLSYRYATALIGALQSKGVSAAMTPLGRGTLTSAGDAQSKAKSRRVDFTVSAR